MQVVCYRMLPLMPGSLEVKLPTYGQRKQQWWEESEKRERESEEKSQRREKQKREDQSARKDRKVRKHCVFPMFFGSGGSKSRLKRGCGAICSDERSKNCHCCGTKRSTVFFRGKRDGFSTSPKVSETWRLSGNLKNHGRRGTFEQDLQRCITQGRRGTRDMSADMFGGQGADFLRGVVFLEHQILRFAEVVLRDRCSTSHDLALLRWDGKMHEGIGTRLVLHSAFISFPFSKEVSQNCFVFWRCQKFKTWGWSLAEFHRFGAVNIFFLRKYRGFGPVNFNFSRKPRRSASFFVNRYFWLAQLLDFR